MTTTPPQTTAAQQPVAPSPTSATVATTGTGPTVPALVHNTPTPRLIRGLRNALIALLILFSGLTVVATVAPEMASVPLPGLLIVTTA